MVKPHCLIAAGWFQSLQRRQGSRKVLEDDSQWAQTRQLKSVKMVSWWLFATLWPQSSLNSLLMFVDVCWCLLTFVGSCWCLLMICLWNVEKTHISLQYSQMHPNTLPAALPGVGNRIAWSLDGQRRRIFWSLKVCVLNWWTLAILPGFSETIRYIWRFPEMGIPQ